MIASVTPEDIDRRVRYRPAPSALETLGGKIVRSARGKEPAAMVLFDGEEEPRVSYLSKLEWEDG